jgi:fucose permease
LTTSKPRNLIGVTCAAMAQHGIVLLLAGALLPAMMRTFDIREGSAGVLLGAGAIGFILGPMLSGLLSDRAGVRAAFIVGLGGEIAFLAAMGLAPTFAMAVAAYFLLQVAAGFIETSVNIVPTVVGNGKGGSLMNIVHMFFSVGAFLSPLLAGAVLQTTGSWRPAWLITIIPTAALLIAVLAMRFPAAQKAAGAPGAPKPSILAAVRERAILMGAIAMMLYVAAEFGASNWITLYLDKQLGFATLIATSGLSVLWIGLFVGRYINSRLALVRASGELVWWSGLLGVVTGLLLLTATTPFMAYFWLFGLGLAMSGIYPNIMAELNGRNPERMGLITGFLAQSAGIGSAIAQPTIGLVGERFGLTVGFSLVAVLMGLVSLVTLLGAGSFRALRHQTPPVEAQA